MAENADAIAVVTGRIVGDPELHLERLFLAPGSTSGFITAVAEPPTIALLGLLLLVLRFSGRRREP